MNCQYRTMTDEEAAEIAKSIYGPVKYCSKKGCKKKSMMQSIGGFCEKHQAEIWNALSRKRK